MDAMDAMLEDFGLRNEFGTFSPHAKYHVGMDALYYLEEDCAYRAERIDQFLSILWHPHEARAVGIKLKGIRYYFTLLKELFGLSEEDWPPLIEALEKTARKMLEKHNG